MTVRNVGLCSGTLSKFCLDELGGNNRAYVGASKASYVSDCYSNVRGLSGGRGPAGCNTR